MAIIDVVTMHAYMGEASGVPEGYSGLQAANGEDPDEGARIDKTAQS